MQKFTVAFRLESLLVRSLSQNCLSNSCKSVISLITSSLTFSENKAYSSIPGVNDESSVLHNYIIGSLKFSSRFSHIKSIEKPEKVVRFFRAVGFTDAQIESVVHILPRILFANVEKTLIPKIMFFQELGISGPHLGALVSKNPTMLTCHMDRRLKPCIHLIKEVLKNDGKNRSNEKVNDDLVRILKRCNRIVHTKSELEANIQYLQICGVVGSQLSALLLRRTRIFTMHKKKLSELVSIAIDMGFIMGSRMLVHGISCLSGTSIKALNGKFEAFRMFGFSKVENALMFRKSPLIFALSEANLRLKLEFHLNNIKIKKSVLVQYPVLLSYSIDERVIPRYKVLEKLKSKRLLKNSCFYRAMCLSNEKFLEQYILRFKNDAEELLLAYNGQLPDTSEKYN